MRPIFDRDEIKHWIPDVPEKRVVAMIHDKSVENSGKRSLSPIRKRVKNSMSSERQGIQHRLIRVALKDRVLILPPDCVSRNTYLFFRSTS